VAALTDREGRSAAEVESQKEAVSVLSPSGIYLSLDGTSAGELSTYWERVGEESTSGTGETDFTVSRMSPGPTDKLLRKSDR
jgi:hypothetical protein